MYTLPDLEAKLAAATATDAVITGKKVVMRACLNVPTDASGNIIGDTRLVEALPEIQRIAASSARLVVLGHMGRPDGQAKPEFNFGTVRKYLEEKLGYSIGFLTSIDQQPTEKVSLMENIRFNPEEESKDESVRLAFAQKISTLAEVYVNDAFPDYREAASTYELAKVLPAFIGETYAREVRALSKFNNPARPFVAVLGGAKLSEKIDVLNSLGQIADRILVGGAMAYTLMKAKGIEVGKSLVEDSKLEVAKEIIAQYGAKLLLPVDHLALPEFKEPENSQQYQVIEGQNIPADLIAVDIGPKTRDIFIKEIGSAKSILWNGPMGVFEWSGAAKGTQKVGEAIVLSNDTYKLAGGGDSIAAISRFKIEGFNHISTGGGAMLAFLSYDKFPTLDVILNK